MVSTIAGRQALSLFWYEVALIWLFSSLVIESPIFFISANDFVFFLLVVVLFA
jgi:hypothetical protein